MRDIRITAGPHVFGAHLEHEAAPLTCAKFVSLLPYRERIIHVRWSGEACWIPLGGLDLGLPLENATSYPHRGRSCSTRAASAKPRSSSPMAPYASRARSANSPAAIS